MSARDSFFLKIIAISIPSFMIGLDMLIMSVAIVPMAKSLQADLSTIQWFMSGYGIGVSSFLITTGKLADMYTHRRMLLVGIILFAIASALVAITRIADLIIIWRILQGIGGAFCLTTTISLAKSSFKKHQQTIALGLMIAFSGLGMALGPVIGGVIIHYTNWSVAFWINLPIGAINCCFVLLAFPAKKSILNERRIDFAGVILLTCAMILTTLGISQGTSWGWLSSATLCCLIIAACLFMIFFIVESKLSYALLPLNLFKTTNFTIANIAGFSGYFILLSWLFVFSVYLPKAYQLSPLYTGLYELPFSIIFFISGVSAGKVINKIGIKPSTIAGYTVITISLVLLLSIKFNSPYWYLAIAFALMGLGFVYVNASSIPAAIEFMKPELAGSASGTSMLFRWFGAAIGVAIMSTIYGTTSIQYFFSQLSQHPSWQKILSKQEAVKILLSHHLDHKIEQLFKNPSTQKAIDQIYFQSYTHAVTICMRVLFGLGIMTLIGCLLFIRTAHHQNQEQTDM